MSGVAPQLQGIFFLHKLFARYDIPDAIYSDNDTQFTAYKFKDFL